MRASPSGRLLQRLVQGGGATRATRRTPRGTASLFRRRSARRNRSAPNGAASRGQPVCPQGSPLGPPHDFADQMAVGVGVIGVARAGLPPRCGRSQGFRHAVPVPQVVVGAAGHGWPAPRPGDRVRAARSPLPCRRRRTRARRCRSARPVRPGRRPPAVGQAAPRTPFRRSRSRPSVSWRQGTPVAGSAQPPTRSTTVTPSTTMHTAAPTSPLAEVLDELIPSRQRKRESQ